MQADIIMAMLEASKPNDSLKLGSNPSVNKLLATQPREDGERSEVVVFSSLVTKFNRKKKAQERIMMITQRAIYNMVQGRLGQIQRRIPIGTVGGIILAETGDEFVLHISNDYDYHFDSYRRADIVHCIALRYKTLMGKELRAEVAHGDVTAHVITKVQMNKQKEIEKGTAAPKKNKLTQKIRAMVSKKKIRYQKDGFDLDLTYITGRIIAMGFPSFGGEGMYRNSYNDVLRFLETRHRNHYKVYNLCVEKKYQYDCSKFHNRVACFPSSDHNPPPFEMLIQFVKDCMKYLAEHPDNVIAVHCKAGKGRTGCFLSAYMLWSGLFFRANDALAFFANQRTHDGNGVTIPSQIRFVRYSEQLMRDFLAPGRPIDYRGVPTVLIDVRLSNLHNDQCDVESPMYFIINDVEGHRIFDSRKDPAPERRLDEHFSFQDDNKIQVAVIPETKTLTFMKLNIRLLGQFSCTFFDKMSQKVMSFHLHTLFLGSKVTLFKPDLDKACKDTKNKKTPWDVTVELWFAPDKYNLPEKPEEPAQVQVEARPKKKNCMQHSEELQKAARRIHDLEAELNFLRSLTGKEGSELNSAPK